MRLSARNQIKGRVVGVEKGQTTALVQIEIGPCIVVTASVTNHAVDDLALAVGNEAVTVIKASDGMIGKSCVARPDPRRALAAPLALAAPARPRAQPAVVGVDGAARPLSAADPAGLPVAEASAGGRRGSRC